MFWSKSFIPTLKEASREAESSAHKFMLRAGLCRMLTSGVYSYLPLGLKVLSNIENVVREEMDGAGAQELLLPALQPLELWERSGRNKAMEEIMIRFTDRRKRLMCLGPTHEEVIADLVGGNISSYRQLPFILYQIQTKFRDEIRPRGGLIRSCEFIMKDAYSFDFSQEGLDKNYNLMHEAYLRIFKRLGIDCVVTEADSGVMGGKVSHEFMVLSNAGEDMVKGKKAIEIGHIFKLGTKYSESMGAFFSDDKGVKRPVIMGCYGIGVSRLVSAIIEVNHDEKGIVWPKEVAPYDCLILPLNVMDGKSMPAAQKIYDELKNKKIKALIDDRDERAGVKFNDADLIGIPLKIIVGSKGLENKEIELQKRLGNEKKIVKLDSAVEEIIKTIALKC